MSKPEINIRTLLSDIQQVIESGKKQATIAVNTALTVTYWRVGQRINVDVLNNERAEYGKQIVSQLATQLAAQYGKSYETRNLRRMMQFAELFPDNEIVVPLARQLSWSHLYSFMKHKHCKTSERSHVYRNNIDMDYSTPAGVAPSLPSFFLYTCNPSGINEYK